MENKCIKCGKNLLEELYSFDNLCEDCYHDEMEKEKINKSKEYNIGFYKWKGHYIEGIEAHNYIIRWCILGIGGIFGISAGVISAIEHNFPWFVIVYIEALIMGSIAEYIADKKGIKNGFAWGFFLNIIGLIVVGVLPNENTQKVESVNSVTENAEAIKKFKELLDMGAITEEEFEIKKKELLK
jgi:uncharacterized membrane protein